MQPVKDSPMSTSFYAGKYLWKWNMEWNRGGTMESGQGGGETGDGVLPRNQDELLSDRNICSSSLYGVSPGWPVHSNLQSATAIISSFFVQKQLEMDIQIRLFIDWLNSLAINLWHYQFHVIGI